MNEPDSKADEPTTRIDVTVNDEEYSVRTEDRTLLVHFLRDGLGLTGTHQGCVVGKCGACTVLHNGTPKKSCMLYAPQVDGDEITTVEGLAGIAEAETTDMETRDGATLHPLQMGFKRNHGLQCGFCTPGFLMTAYALLEENDDPDPEEIKTAISGNICRCTGYTSIVDSIEWAAAMLRDDADVDPEAPLTDGGQSTCSCNCDVDLDYPTPVDGGESE
jgi:carbon-monoxide dehydrogenase small subunit